MPYVVFFLGGHDLEMLRIRDILAQQGLVFHDKDLAWGAKASSYKQEIQEALRRHKTPVLIELEIDMDLPPWTKIIDHHGSRASEQASIIQVMELIGQVPSKWDQFIAANDVGYIPAMVAAGADTVTIRAIRHADREAQGVTEAMEEEAEYSIECRNSVENGVTIVRIRHNKWSTVADRLFASWPDGKENLIVVCELPGETQEVYYFGPGDICKKMKDGFPGAWGGGSGYGDPTGQGYAGCRTSDTEMVVRFITHHQH